MRKKIKILVVDRSPLVAPRVRDLLNEWKDVIFVGAARNSEESLNALECLPFDFVLLDLPFRSAAALLTSSKQLYPATKVVMFTNNTESAYRDICLQLGADYFIDKSSEFKTLEDILLKELLVEV